MARSAARPAWAARSATIEEVPPSVAASSVNHWAIVSPRPEAPVRSISSVVVGGTVEGVVADEAVDALGASGELAASARSGPSEESRGSEAAGLRVAAAGDSCDALAGASGRRGSPASGCCGAASAARNRSCFICSSRDRPPAICSACSRSRSLAAERSPATRRDSAISRSWRSSALAPSSRRPPSAGASLCPGADPLGRSAGERVAPSREGSAARSVLSS